MFFIFMEFIAFPQKDNAILTKGFQDNAVVIESSGSVGLYYGGKCNPTFPNETLHESEKMDWCSNIVPKDSNSQPWLQYSFKNKGMRLTGYSVRNGCCWHLCCCLETGKIYDGYCCCRLYSYSLLGSNDNKTWTTIHKIEKDAKFYDCQFKTYEFTQTESYKYIRFALDQEYPGCPRCMQLNQIEFYGTTTDSLFSTFEDEDNDESVSIIGKVKSFN